VVKRHQADMARIYAFDLGGAGLGCLLLVPLLDHLGGPGTVMTAGILFVAGHLLLRAGAGGGSLLGWVPGGLLLVAGIGLIGVNAVHPLLKIPSVKEGHEDEVIFSKWNSFSRVTVEGTRSDHAWLKMDSSAATRIFSGEIAKQGYLPARRFSETRIASLVYALRRTGPALIIGPGGGADVIAALTQGQKQITAVEINPIIVNDVMRGRFLEYSGRLYQKPEVKVVVAEGRSYVRSSPERFHTIQATLVDTWAATAAGAFTLSENNLYTLEAFDDYLHHLEGDGVLTMTRWNASPPREFLRLLVLGRAALERMGVRDHAGHFYIGADSRMATFLLKRTPFTPAECATLDRYLRESSLTRLYSPVAREATLFDDFLRTDDWRGYVKHYPEDISAAPDDRPFFFYTVKPESMLLALRDVKALSSHNLGLFLLLVLIGVVGSLVVLFFVLPLFLLRRDVLRGRTGTKARYLLYFIGLGLGFITVEIALMQKFVLFLGHPVYSLVVILFALLVASGVGSYLCRDVARQRIARVLGRNLLLLFLVVGVYLVALSPLFAVLAGWPVMLRALLSAVLLVPLGLLMGSFLPLGVLAAGESLAEVVPWAWGMNGAASVLGSVASVAMAMNLGFSLTLVVGLLWYLLAFLSGRRLFASAA